MAMTPEDKERLAVHIKEIAKILYKNTPPEKIETFEGIETAIRDQVLEHVSPKIGMLPIQQIMKLLLCKQHKIGYVVVVPIN